MPLKNLLLETCVCIKRANKSKKKYISTKKSFLLVSHVYFSDYFDFHLYFPHNNEVYNSKLFIVDLILQ